MKKLSDSNSQIDPITLGNELKKEGMLEKIGGMSYLADLMTIVASTDNIIFYMKIVKEYAVKRSIKELLSQTTKTIQTMESSELIKVSDDLKSTILDNGDIENLFIDASTISAPKPKHRRHPDWVYESRFGDWKWAKLRNFVDFDR